MTIPFSLLCPIDFSSSSLDALTCALSIGRRYNASITVVTVDDQLLNDVADVRMGQGWFRETTEAQLRALVTKAQSRDAPVHVSCEVRTGKVAPAILQAAKTSGAQLIVMSTHGRSGAGKWFFGATAERVLHETTIPVLLVPADSAAPRKVENLAGPMLVPVDFSTATNHQVRVASWIAESLHLRMIIGHALEPVDLPVPDLLNEAEITSERHRFACAGLQSIALQVPMRTRPEILISSGPPAETIAGWVAQTGADLLVMSLHGGVDGAPRVGSVTYRAIGLSRVPTLALPPAIDS